MKAGSFDEIIDIKRCVKRDRLNLYRDVLPNGAQVIENKKYRYNG